MGREVRRVPRTWKHPRDEKGAFVPLHYQKFHGEYEYFRNAWECGMTQDYGSEDPRALKPKDERYDTETYAEYAGPLPTPESYMPDWLDYERTHIQMYEDTTEGTPISPAMKTPEELERWLADNNASSFGAMGETYEQWLATIKAGYAFSAMSSPETGLISGVEANEVLSKK